MILVTGATGLVGKALCASLLKHYPVRIAVRNAAVEGLPAGAEVTQKVLSVEEDWSNALIEVNTVVHCAARVHIMNEQSADALTAFRRVNVDGTLQLAKQAADAGVSRFIFLSSIKVNGEQTKAGKPFTDDQQPDPGDPYGISKMEAENGLMILAKETCMEVVIIRPPLVYGPGVKANFLSMMQVLWRGIPLPFGAVTGNKRSLVSLDNLIDLIVTCLDHPAAANQTFLVSDGEDLSTAALLRRMGEALGRPARLVSAPIFLLKFGAWLLRKPGLVPRLCGSLEVNINKTRELLGWAPPVTLDEGLRRTAVHWRKSQQMSRS